MKTQENNQGFRHLDDILKGGFKQGTVQAILFGSEEAISKLKSQRIARQTNNDSSAFTKVGMILREMGKEEFVESLTKLTSKYSEKKPTKKKKKNK